MAHGRRSWLKRMVVVVVLGVCVYGLRLVRRGQCDRGECEGAVADRAKSRANVIEREDAFKPKASVAMWQAVVLGDTPDWWRWTEQWWWNRSWWGNDQLKVLILRGEMRCQPEVVCTAYWRRFITTNKVDEVYIITKRNVTGKSVFKCEDPPLFVALRYIALCCTLLLH